MTRNNHRGARTLGQSFQLIHEVGDFAIGVFVPIPQHLVGRVENDQAELMLGKLLLELRPEER